jgi:hypothetical protein
MYPYNEFINKIENITGIKVKMSKSLLLKRLKNKNKLDISLNKELYQQKLNNLLIYIINAIDKKLIINWHLILDKIYEDYLIIKKNIINFELDFINDIINKLYYHKYIYELHECIIIYIKYIINTCKKSDQHILNNKIEFLSNLNNNIINENNICMEKKEWLDLIINYINNNSENDIISLFDTIFNQCPLIKYKILNCKPIFYNNIVNELYIYGHIYKCQKALYKYCIINNINNINMNDPLLPKILRNKFLFYHYLDISITTEIDKRMSIGNQLKIGYTGYLLFKNHNIPDIIHNLISNFIVGTNYKIKYLY